MMRIFYDSERSDPLVLDSEAALHLFALQLREVAAGHHAESSFTADTDGSPAPYSELLCGIKVQVVNASRPVCRLTHGRWLELQASEADLNELCRNIEGLQNGSHTHLYSNPVSLIFEAEDSWPRIDTRVVSDAIYIKINVLPPS